jgi:hypothetical protein
MCKLNDVFGNNPVLRKHRYEQAVTEHVIKMADPLKCRCNI